MEGRPHETQICPHSFQDRQSLCFPSVSQFCWRFRPGFLADRRLPLRAEALPGRLHAAGAPPVAPAAAHLLAVAPGRDHRPVVQRGPAGGAHQLLHPHRLLLRRLLLLAGPGARRGAEPVLGAAGGAPAEVGRRRGSQPGGDEAGAGGGPSRREAEEARGTQLVSREGSGDR